MVKLNGQKAESFFANRAAETVENSTIDNWEHIRGDLNPSDIGTRGITKETLTEYEWVLGPSLLKDHPDDRLLPLQPVNVVPYDHSELAVIANSRATG